MPRHWKILKRKNTKLHKIYHTGNDLSQRMRFQTNLTGFEQELEEFYQLQERHEETEIIEAIETNPKYFYTNARKYRKVQQRIGPLADDVGNMATDQWEWLQFSDQYREAFSVPAQLTLDLNNTQQLQIEDINFDENHIIKAINEVSSNSLSGPDRFPGIILKNCKLQLAKPLYLI